MDLSLYLTNLDSSTNTITIYDGVEYGFDVQAIPEPETAPSALGGLVLLGLWYYRNRRRSCRAPARLGVYRTGKESLSGCLAFSELREAQRPYHPVGLKISTVP
jgi:hypothetical protein